MTTHTELPPIPEGPWTNEPMRADFQHAGFRCVMRRGPLASWCGYVAVPPGHPWHGKDYNDLDGVEVHGGLTFSAASDGLRTVAGQPDLWWFGFDCAHSGDLVPGMLRWSSAHPMDRYRNERYVRAECESLAAQAETTGKVAP